MRVEAFGVRRSCLCGDVLGILEGSRPRQLTVQIAPGFGFGACDRGLLACMRFSRSHRQMIPKDGVGTRLWQTPILRKIILARGATMLTGRSRSSLVLPKKKKVHYEAPAAPRLERDMSAFLAWLLTGRAGRTWCCALQSPSVIRDDPRVR